MPDFQTLKIFALDPLQPEAFQFCQFANPFRFFHNEVLMLGDIPCLHGSGDSASSHLAVVCVVSNGKFRNKITSPVVSSICRSCHCNAIAVRDSCVLPETIGGHHIAKFLFRDVVAFRNILLQEILQLVFKRHRIWKIVIIVRPPRNHEASAAVLRDFVVLGVQNLPFAPVAKAMKQFKPFAEYADIPPADHLRHILHQQDIRQNIMFLRVLQKPSDLPQQAALCSRAFLHAVHLSCERKALTRERIGHNISTLMPFGKHGIQCNHIADGK